MASQSNTEIVRKEVTGLHRITKKRILELCKKDKLYQTPALNDVLYLHYQGFQYIECLEEYTELKCIWLECNAISEIEGLDNQPKLKCLFLQNNLIKNIENLQHCVELDTINLASNHIRKIENCGSDILPVLSTLNLASNYLSDSESLKELENCRYLSVLDLSNNRIDDILVVKIFAKMPQLRVLVLQGNPVVSKLPQYRKTIILECKELTYLDSRPVFPKDRACSEAWKRGGYAEERKENERWNRKERKKIRDSVNATIRLRNKHKGPDNQRPLLESSDSDGEINEEQHRRQEEIDAAVNMELGFWDDVTDVGDTKSETSDINESSSTSVISTTDSNGDDSVSDLKAAASAEMQCNRTGERKSRNDSSKAKRKIIEITDSDNVASILKIATAEHTADKSKECVENKSETKKRTKRVKFIDEIDTELEAKQMKIEVKAENYEVDQSNYENSDGNDIQDEEECKKAYEETVDAICRATMDDLSTTNVSSTKRVHLPIETVNILDDQDYEPEIMMIDDSEEKMRQRIREENAKAPEDPIMLIVPKTLPQLKYERECREVNRKVERDLGEFSSNMDNLIKELKMGNVNDKSDSENEISESNFDDSNSSQDSQLDELEHPFELTVSAKETKRFSLGNREKGLHLEVIEEVSETDILNSEQAASAGHSDEKAENVLDGNQINDVEEEIPLRDNAEWLTEKEVMFEKVFNDIWKDAKLCLRQKPIFNPIEGEENYTSIDLKAIHTEENLSETDSIQQPSSRDNQSVGIIDKSTKEELDTDDYKVGRIVDPIDKLEEVCEMETQRDHICPEELLRESKKIQERYIKKAKEFKDLLQKIENDLKAVHTGENLSETDSIQQRSSGDNQSVGVIDKSTKEELDTDDYKVGGIVDPIGRLEEVCDKVTQCYQICSKESLRESKKIQETYKKEAEELKDLLQKFQNDLKAIHTEENLSETDSIQQPSSRDNQSFGIIDKSSKEELDTDDYKVGRIVDPIDKLEEVCEMETQRDHICPEEVLRESQKVQERYIKKAKEFKDLLQKIENDLKAVHTGENLSETDSIQQRSSGDNQSVGVIDKSTKEELDTDDYKVGGIVDPIGRLEEVCDKVTQCYQICSKESLRESKKIQETYKKEAEELKDLLQKFQNDLKAIHTEENLSETDSIQQPSSRDNQSFGIIDKSSKEELDTDDYKVGRIVDPIDKLEEVCEMETQRDHICPEEVLRESQKVQERYIKKAKEFKDLLQKIENDLKAVHTGENLSETDIIQQRSSVDNQSVGVIDKSTKEELDTDDYKVGGIVDPIGRLEEVCDKVTQCYQICSKESLRESKKIQETYKKEAEELKDLLQKFQNDLKAIHTEENLSETDSIQQPSSRDNQSFGIIDKSSKEELDTDDYKVGRIVDPIDKLEEVCEMETQRDHICPEEVLRESQKVQERYIKKAKEFKDLLQKIENDLKAVHTGENLSETDSIQQRSSGDNQSVGVIDKSTKEELDTDDYKVGRIVDPIDKLEEVCEMETQRDHIYPEELLSESKKIQESYIKKAKEFKDLLQKIENDLKAVHTGENLSETDSIQQRSSGDNQSVGVIDKSTKEELDTDDYKVGRIVDPIGRLEEVCDKVTQCYQICSKESLSESKKIQETYKKEAKELKDLLQKFQNDLKAIHTRKYFSETDSIQQPSSGDNQSVGIIDKSTKEELDTDDYTVGRIVDPIDKLEEVCEMETQCDQIDPGVICSEESLSESKKIQETYNKEAKELKDLLQKLENENEKLYNLNCTYREMLDHDIETEGKYLDHAVSDTTEKLCEDIVDELLDELDLEEMEKQQQKKVVRNYQFPDIESDEEYSYTEKKLPEEPVKTINDVLTSFNSFLREIASKNRENIRQNDWSRPRVSRTDDEKAASLQNLRQNNNSQPIFPESAESIDEQLVEMKKRQTEQVQKLVDRVYAQKDKYDDTLDVVDGKLVVVKKDTGEIEDLPEKPIYSGSDNGEEYDTAQSDEEGAAGGWAVYTNDEDSKSNLPCGRWTQKYKPIPRRSAEHLVNEALERNRSEFEMDEEENYENYYLHPAQSDYRKLFGNIDDEFFSSLDLNNVEIGESDENQSVATCARSYDELRQYIRTNTTELLLTDEEVELLEKMKIQEEEERAATDSLNDKLIEEEDFLLKKMVDRQRDSDGEERQTIQMSDIDALEDIAMQRMAQHETKRLVTSLVKLFEYNIENKEELECIQKEIQKENEELIADKLYENIDDDLKEIVNAEMDFYNIEKGRVTKNIDDEDEFDDDDDVHEEKDTGATYLNRVHTGITASFNEGELKKIKQEMLDFDKDQDQMDTSEYEDLVIKHDMDTDKYVTNRGTSTQTNNETTAIEAIEILSETQDSRNLVSVVVDGCVSSRLEDEKENENQKNLSVLEVVTKAEDVILPQISKSIFAEYPIDTQNEGALNILESFLNEKDCNLLETLTTIISEHPEENQYLDNQNILQSITKVEDAIIISETSEPESSESVFATEFVDCEPFYEETNITNMGQSTQINKETKQMESTETLPEAQDVKASLSSVVGGSLPFGLIHAEGNESQKNLSGLDIVTNAEEVLLPLISKSIVAEYLIETQNDTEFVDCEPFYEEELKDEESHRDTIRNDVHPVIGTEVLVKKHGMYTDKNVTNMELSTQPNKDTKEMEATETLPEAQDTKALVSSVVDESVTLGLIDEEGNENQKNLGVLDIVSNAEEVLLPQISKSIVAEYPIETQNDTEFVDCEPFYEEELKDDRYGDTISNDVHPVIGTEVLVIKHDMDTEKNVTNMEPLTQTNLRVLDIVTKANEVILPQISKSIVAEYPIETQNRGALNILESVRKDQDFNLLETSMTVTSEHPKGTKNLENKNILESITKAEVEVIISEPSEPESSESVVATEFVDCEPFYEEELKDEKSYGDTISNDVEPVIGTEITESKETDSKETGPKETFSEDVVNNESQQRPHGGPNPNNDDIFNQIDVNLEILNDNDEVVNELTVNADIIYDV